MGRKHSGEDVYKRQDLYKVNKVPHGTVRRMWYNSPTLGMDRRLTVYTPAGYENGKKMCIRDSQYRY